MKKILFYIALLVVLISPVVSSAATVSVSTSGNYIAGHTYTVNVVVNPQSSKIYTSKVEINFPASLLRVNNFTFSSGWMPVAQTGYDSVDNVGGTLIKTAGYPGGITAPATFGSFTLYAKTTGTGSISVSNGTQLLDANNQNTFSASGAVSVVVKEATVVTPVTNTTVTTPEPAVVSSPTTEATSAPVTDNTQNTAAVGNTGSTDNSSVWLWSIIAVIVIGVGGFFAFKFAGKK